MEEAKKEVKREVEFKDLLTENGIRVCGLGLVINKLDALNKKQDRTNQLLSFIEKKIEHAVQNQDLERFK